MRTFLKNGNGLVQTDTWEPNCWVHVECPTLDDRRFLFEELQIPEAFYNDVEDIDERPRIEIEDGWYFIIMRFPIKIQTDDIPYATIPMGLIFRGDVFVSLSFHTTEVIPDFINFTRRKNIIMENSFDLVLKLSLSSSVWFLKYLKQINYEIKEAENQLEKSIKNEDLQTLLQIEKCLVLFTTSLKGNDILVARLKNLRDYRDTYDEDLMEDVEIELRQALGTTNIYSDIMSGMMNAYASVISNNLNIVMKTLTSISIILMIPTLVASFYGMNIPNSFEQNHYGFFIVIALSFLLSLVVLILFRRRNYF
ncbi:MAG: magnesium transporter CorA [Ignavibacteria bacterium GWF2_33_9]|nr:MAG: magnesium transporter CorA [Ignavibacteria bacterium GWF2_33_9]